MKKLFCIIALAAITLGSITVVAPAHAQDTTKVKKKMKGDKGKMKMKMKGDSTKWKKKDSVK